MSSLRPLEVVAISACLFLAHACSGGDGPQQGAERWEAAIGPEGGAVEITGAGRLDGVKLTVPPGAVTQRTTFYIEFTPQAPALPTGLSEDHAALTFGPSATFAGDLQLTFPVDYVPTGETDILGAYCWNATSARWVVIPARRVEGGALVVGTHALGLCRWGTVRLGQVDDDTVRAWMDDLRAMTDDWAALEAAVMAKVRPFVAMVEDPVSFHRCANQDTARNLLRSWRQQALDGVAAHLATPAVYEACKICDSGTCLPSVCDAEQTISGQPIAWLQKEIEIYLESLFVEAACPSDLLAPFLGKMVAWGKYQEAIRTLRCDWRCVLTNGDVDFYVDLLVGNVCSLSLFAIDLYQQRYGCS